MSEKVPEVPDEAPEYDNFIGARGFTYPDYEERMQAVEMAELGERYDGD